MEILDPYTQEAVRAVAVRQFVVPQLDAWSNRIAKIEQRIGAEERLQARHWWATTGRVDLISSQFDDLERQHLRLYGRTEKLASMFDDATNRLGRLELFVNKQKGNNQ